VTTTATGVAATPTGGQVPPAGRQARLQLARASYGVALVMAPGLVIYLATGRFPSRRGRRVAQLLGARHLLQAAITAFVPVPEVFALGAGVDAAHAGSMLLLAAADPAERHAALTDAAAEGIFAAVGRSAAGGLLSSGGTGGPTAQVPGS
jgi:hypothetical protein